MVERHDHCISPVAAESHTYGWGGVQARGGVIGMSPNTIRKGLEELAARDENPQAPVRPGLRRTGAGRKKHTQTDPHLRQDLESLVEPTIRGDPQSPARDLGGHQKRKSWQARSRMAGANGNPRANPKK